MPLQLRDEIALAIKAALAPEDYRETITPTAQIEQSIKATGSAKVEVRTKYGSATLNLRRQLIAELE